MSSIQDLRIVFFGTPDFAVGSLKALVEAGANIVAVVTAPDKPAGRGKKLSEPAVKQYAQQQGLQLLQPEKLKAPGFLEQLKELRADLQVVVAFRMLPEVVWNMPPMGTINVHASLLPQYRGAAPINWAIINGETMTGVTTFKLKHEIDTGDILLQREIPILPEDNAGMLHDKLMLAGANLLVATVEGLAAGTLDEKPQSNASDAKHAPKLYRDNMQINWESRAEDVHNLVRGLSPYPAVHTVLAEKNIKIYRTHVSPGVTGTAPGAYFTDGRTYLRFAAADGWIYIDELQQEGKKRMGIEEYLRGFRP